jgi:hypothetical protein
MQLVGCDRIHEEVAARRTGATTPREPMPKRRSKRPRINNGGYSTAAIAVEAQQRGMHLIRKPAKLTGNSQERAMYMGGVHQTWCE